MANNGSINKTLNNGDSYTIPSGYTSGGTISVSSLADSTEATAAASNIEYGYTAWVNGEKIIGTKIVTTPLVIPTINGTYTYNGSEQNVIFNNYDSSKLIIGGTYCATEAGTYLVSFTPVGGYEWEDETTDTKYVEWSINKLSLIKPNLSNSSCTYNTSSQSPVVNNYNSSYENQSGTSSATTVGTYTVTWSLKNTTSSMWSDGTISDISNSWSISKLSLTVPSLTNTSYTYNGGTKAPTVNNYNSSYENQSGTSSAINANTYTITWALKDTTNTQWSDSTISNKSAFWSIAKASGYISLSSTSGTVNKNSSITFTVSSYSGSLSVSSSNTGAATCSISGNTVTVNGITGGSSATITINVATSTNYNATSATYSISVNYIWNKYNCNATPSSYASTYTSNQTFTFSRSTYVGMALTTSDTPKDFNSSTGTWTASASGWVPFSDVPTSGTMCIGTGYRCYYPVTSTSEIKSNINISEYYYLIQSSPEWYGSSSTVSVSARRYYSYVTGYTYSCGSTYYGIVSSSSSSAYPSNGTTDNTYWYVSA